MTTSFFVQLVLFVIWAVQSLNPYVADGPLGYRNAEFLVDNSVHNSKLQNMGDGAIVIIF